MKQITSETFPEVLSGNSLLFFYRENGCGNCAATKPFVESFEKEWVNVFLINADEEKELVNKYAPQWKWQLPLTVYLEGGVMKNFLFWPLNAERLLWVTKTLYNISERELMGIALDLDTDFAKKRKELFELEWKIMSVKRAIELRQNGTTPQGEMDFILPSETATTMEPPICETCQ